MLCTDHPGMDSVLKRYLGDTVKADTISLINDDNSARTYKKNGGIDLNKFIEAIDGIGHSFESHFEVHKNRFTDQKKRHAEQKVSEASKEYCHLKLLLLKEPLLSVDPVVMHRMTFLKNVIEEFEINENNNKKQCVLERESDESTISDSIPTSITNYSHSTINHMED
jgi:hypothetical protein